MRIDPLEVIRWLVDSGVVPDPGRTTADEARRWLLGVCEPVVDVFNPPDHRITAAVLGLVHSMAHRFMKALAARCGLNADSLAEYLFPSAAAFLIYANTRSEFVLGGIEHVFRFDLGDALSELDADPRCVFDPPCRRSFGGACAACLHTSEVACERFNTVLDRNLLFGTLPPSQRRIGVSSRGGDMARLLDAVTPLADLLARTSDPDATVASIRAACADGPAAVLRVAREAASAAGIDPRLMTLAAAHAGITATDGRPPTVAELAAIGGALEILVDARREPDVSLVFTVPAFLATAFDAFTSKTPVVRAERTATVVSAVAASGAVVADDRGTVPGERRDGVARTARDPGPRRWRGGDGGDTRVVSAIPGTGAGEHRRSRRATTRGGWPAGSAAGVLMGRRWPRGAPEGGGRRRHGRLPWLSEPDRPRTGRARRSRGAAAARLAQPLGRVAWAARGCARRPAGRGRISLIEPMTLVRGTWW